MVLAADMGTPLPREVLEMQIGQIDLLMAMYPNEGCIHLGEVSRAVLDSLRGWLGDDGDAPDASSIPEALDVSMTSETTDERPREVKLEMAFPLRYIGDDEPVEPPPAKIRLQQAAWMSKADTVALATQIPQDQDLFSAIETINEIISAYEPPQNQTSISSSQPLTQDSSLARVWFYFPSISTRSKRDDLVNQAPSYQLTGFLLAGKPGILCLEGGSQAVDDFMKYIKTESWGDIPSHHKKVSERYRQAIETRAFHDMTEITDQLEKRGERSNRNDMKTLEAWLGERGLGDAFAKVLI
ncbi:hypothetical protein VHEMI03014 [[Torrubiella] hemipterigena]|uniref:Small nuclear ribonucleoprotein Prp3 C-terminal domain-containing protein n=1 Tax=[Torrubiella] hemipterigena TaxID=1531966 RepID=A0A0A1SRA3_9HYPO|nr:hypothetical protein VHEMI03014 [[Torrubiella] hemipterigena]